jgi:hypothetical protein
MEYSRVSGEATNPGAELLIECLRGSPLALRRDTDWGALLSLAEVHGVLPLTHRALVENGLEVPEFFLNAVRNSQSSTEVLAAHLEQLLASFSECGIEVIPLKGPVLAETLYGDIRMRPCTDLDLLVRISDFTQAERILTSAGWIASSLADEYHRKFVRNGILVELHFGVASPRSFPFDLNGVWGRAQSSAFRSQPIKAMSEVDRALYLLLHGLKHAYGKLIWIVDAAFALNAVRECSPRVFVERARALWPEQVLYIGCAMVAEVLPRYLPEDLSVALADSPEALQAAHAGVERILAGNADMGHGPERWGLYLQIETEPDKRWSRRLMFFIPTIEDDRWAASHRIPLSLAPLVRPFRMLAKYGIRRIWRAVFPPSL